MIAVIIECTRLEVIKVNYSSEPNYWDAYLSGQSY